MSEELSLKEIQKEWHGTMEAYITGFTASIVLTALSFFLVITRFLDNTTTILTIVTLALTQAVIQLHFFLHLGQEHKPRWESLVFGFMLMILLIIVLGSIWIIFDLNSRMMPGMTGEMAP